MSWARRALATAVWCLISVSPASGQQLGSPLDQCQGLVDEEYLSCVREARAKQRQAPTQPPQAPAAARPQQPVPEVRGAEQPRPGGGRGQAAGRQPTLPAPPPQAPLPQAVQPAYPLPAPSAGQPAYRAAPPPAPPAIPARANPGTASAPGQPIATARVPLNWASVPGATHYQLGVLDTNDNRLVIDQQVRGTTSFTATLAPGRGYRWNVAACNTVGCSRFTSPLYFSTGGGAYASAPVPGATQPPGIIEPPASAAPTNRRYTDDYPYANASTDTVDVWSFYYRECTSFVAWRMNRDAGTRSPPYFFHNTMGGERWSNADNWEQNAKDLGYRVDSRPAPGAIAHWRASEIGSVGHVAYVERVNTDGTVDIAEYNGPGNPHAFGYRLNVRAPRYIHVSSRSAQPVVPANPPPAAAPDAGLQVFGFEQDVPVTSAPHPHVFNISGAALNTVNEIRWSWTGPDGSRNSVWRRGDQNWSRFRLTSSDGRSATVQPVLIAANDPPGSYKWTVTFRSEAGQQVVRAFTVHYTKAPSVAPSPPLAPSTPRAASRWPGPYPAAGNITQDFNVPWSAGEGRKHTGVDIGAAEGTEVRSVSAGEVVLSYDQPGGWGYAVVVKENDYSARAYLHLDSSAIREGRVVAGTLLGRTNSHNHVHYNVCRWSEPATSRDWQTCSRGALGVSVPYDSGRSDPLFPGPFINPHSASASAVIPPTPPPAPPAAPTPAPAVSLQVNGFAGSYSTTSTPYQPSISLTGAGLDTVTEIRWSWSGPNNGSSVWRRSDSNWSRFTPSSDGRSASIRPTLISSDPPGTYVWSVSFRTAGGQQVTKSFEVRYTIAAQPTPRPATKPAAPGGTSPGSSAGPGPTTSRTAVRLSWNNATGATSYDLGVRDLSTNQLVEDRRVNGTSITVTLQPGRQYRWNVAACNDTGCSNYTTPLYFRTPD